MSVEELTTKVMMVFTEEAEEHNMTVREWVTGREGGAYDGDLDYESVEEVLEDLDGTDYLDEVGEAIERLLGLR